MPNRWIEHVKEFAKKNKMSYMSAMTDPDIKKGYIPTERKKQKTEKLEQAMPSTEPKPKNLVIKPRPKKPKAKEDTKKAKEEYDNFNTEEYERFYNEFGKLIIPKREYNSILKAEEKRLAEKYGLKKDWNK
jgi:chemotaxis protein histidine kinase CheA